jgi:hypothetical protein
MLPTASSPYCCCRRPATAVATHRPHATAASSSSSNTGATAGLLPLLPPARSLLQYCYCRLLLLPLAAPTRRPGSAPAGSRRAHAAEQHKHVRGLAPCARVQTRTDQPPSSPTHSPARVPGTGLERRLAWLWNKKGSYEDRVKGTKVFSHCSKFSSNLILLF